MSFDLADIDLQADSEAGSWLHLKDPRTGRHIVTEDDKPVRLRILGPHSDSVKKSADKVSKAKMKREAERTVKNDKGGVITVGESTADELKQDDIEVYLAAIVGWENMSFNGDEKFSKKVIEKMLNDRDWLRPQIFAWVFNQENFIQGRDKS